MSRQIYLDYAAATPLDKRVLDAMHPFFSNKFYNPSATYLASREVREELRNARATVAHWLGARPAEIYFTAGATEANNLAIHGVMQMTPKGEVLVSAIEHDSVLAPAHLYKCNKIATTPKGIIDLDDLKRRINSKTVLISVMMVNNELGTIQPLNEISKIIADERRKRLKADNKTQLYLHTDAAQAGNYLDVHTSRLGADLMSLNGGKIYGPKQTGVLYVKAGIVLRPLIVGGGQERNLRSGTENVSGFIGLAKALDIAQKTKDREVRRLQELRNEFIKALEKKFPQVQINGSSKHQTPHIVHATFPGIDNERLMMELDERGIQVAVGSACSAAKTEPSHVLSAIGMSDELARASLRFSFGRQTTKKQLNKTVKVLSKLIK